MSTTRFPWRRGVLLLAAGVLLTMSAAACDDDGDDGDNDGEASAAEIQLVEDTIRRAVESDGSNADFFFEHVTDNIIETVLFSTRDECVANPDECIGAPTAVESISGTRIDGDTATSVVAIEFGTFEVGAVREAGVWKVDQFQPVSDDVPDGATLVDLDLQDFAFILDTAEIPGDGNFAFHVTNNGEQSHEVVVVAVPPGEDFESAVEAVATEQVPPRALKVFIRPGQVVDMSFDGSLEPGQYALVCFLPDTSDPEFTAHIDKGMFAEFTVE